MAKTYSDMTLEELHHEMTLIQFEAQRRILGDPSKGVSPPIGDSDSLTETQIDHSAVLADPRP